MELETINLTPGEILRQLSLKHNVTELIGQPHYIVINAMEQYTKQECRNKVLECVRIIQEAFAQQYVTLNGRSREDQHILGNCITVLESDIKNQMKKLI